MSTCPENDIHSVYLDGELPEEFLQEYEAHVASCPECSKKLEALTRLKGFVHEDSASIVFSQKNCIGICRGIFFIADYKIQVLQIFSCNLTLCTFRKIFTKNFIKL